MLGDRVDQDVGAGEVPEDRWIAQAVVCKVEGRVGLLRLGLAAGG